MKSTRVDLAISVFAALALSGCAASTTASTESTPSPTPSATNEAACKKFETVTDLLAARIVRGSNASNAEEFKTTMSAMPGQFDEAALKGDGEVAERIETLIANLPDPVHMLFLNSDDYFADVAAVDRACSAEGTEIDATIWN